MKSSTSGLRETRAPLSLRSVWQQAKVGWPDSKLATLQTNPTRASDSASQKKHLGMKTLLCGATFQGFKNARRTAPTKRKVYEDFTRTLMRHRELRVWSSDEKRRREPSWGKKTTRVGKEAALFVLLCLSITQGRVLRSGRFARRFGRGYRRLSVREGTAPGGQTRRVRKACKVSKPGT